MSQTIAVWCELQRFHRSDIFLRFKKSQNELLRDKVFITGQKYCLDTLVINSSISFELESVDANVWATDNCPILRRGELITQKFQHCTDTYNAYDEEDS